MNQKMYNHVMIVRNGENFYAGRARLVDGEWRNFGPIAHAGGTHEAYDALMKLEKEIEERKAAEHQKQVDKIFGDITQAINEASKVLGVDPVDITGNTTFNGHPCPPELEELDLLDEDAEFRAAMDSLTSAVVQEVHEAVEHQFSKRLPPGALDDIVTKAVNNAFSSVQVRYSQDFGLLLRRDVSKVIEQALAPVKDSIRDLHGKTNTTNQRIDSVQTRLGNIELMLNGMQTAIGQFLGKTVNVKFVPEVKG